MIRSLLVALLLSFLGIAHSSNLLTSRQGAAPENQCPEAQECLQRLDDNFLECETLPLPPGAALAPVGPNGYTLEVLREGIQTYYDGSYHSMMLSNGTRFAFVDFPDTEGSNKPDGSMTRVTDAANEIIGDTVPSRIDMVYSHSHYDHIGAGTRFFNYMSERYPMADIFIWGTQEIQTRISRSISKRAPEPTELVDREGSIINLGDNLQLNLTMIEGHTSGDIAVYIAPSDSDPGILMHVDVVFPRYAPFEQLAAAEDIRSYIDIHQELLALDFDIFIGGRNVIGTREDVEISMQFAFDLVDAGDAIVEADLGPAIASGAALFGDPEAVQFGNVWYLLVDVVNRAQVDVCYRILVERWGCVLAGLDISGRSLCRYILAYVIVDV